MLDSDPPLPDLPTLDQLKLGLKQAVWGWGLDGTDLVVTGRHLNLHTSTFPTEIVSCQFANGLCIDLFCKYSEDIANEAHGHRGGVKYEADVYDCVLRKITLSTPRLLGISRPDAYSGTWLITEFLADSMRVSKISESVDSKAMSRAAIWIGKFHSLCQELVPETSRVFLRTYQDSYYEGWAKRTALLAKKSGEEFPWLDLLVARFDEVISLLTGAQQTIIHGEYFPKNIMYLNKAIYPVDWESAAIGPGEIDLVTLMEGWDEEDRLQLRADYVSARWPNGVPGNIGTVICAAQIYHHMRWINDLPKTKVGLEWHWNHLQAAWLEFSSCTEGEVTTEPSG